MKESIGLKIKDKRKKIKDEKHALLSPMLYALSCLKIKEFRNLGM